MTAHPPRPPAGRLRRLRTWLADSGPVLVLAAIAAVGSFDHIAALAERYGQHAWRAWAVAVCIDLMCVMAAREIQRDKRTARPRRGLVSWPSLVLAGGIMLTLAANLAQAHPSPWGWIVAATPAGAFLIAVSMLERRTSHQPPPPAAVEIEFLPDCLAPAAGPDPAPASRLVAPASSAAPLPAPASGLAELDGALVDDARFIIAEHTRLHGQVIGADELARRLRLPLDLATALLTHLTSDRPA